MNSNMVYAKFGKRVATAVVAIALSTYGAQVANASPQTGTTNTTLDNQPSINLVDPNAAKDIIGDISDISIVRSKVEQTTNIVDNLASNDETGVISAVPTSDDTSVITGHQGDIVQFSLGSEYELDSSESLPVLRSNEDAIVVNPTDDGVQFLWTIESGTGVQQLEINASVPQNSFWQKEADGSISLMKVDNSSGLADTVLKSGVPWAFDANGKPLPTSLDVINGKVVQQVDTTGAQFPVVADPSWAWWGSLAVCAGQIALALTPAGTITKIAGTAKLASLLAKAPKLKNAIDKLGGFVKAFNLLLGKLRGTKYGTQVENLLKIVLDEGKGALFNVLGIGACLEVYTQWQ